MKLKTRLRVTFISIIALPLLLTILAFMTIVIYLVNMQPNGTISEWDYVNMSENMQEFVNTTDEAYFTLTEQARTDVRKLEDKAYLEWVDKEIARKSTYIIVRKENELYFAGDEAAADKIFEKLPKYGKGHLAEDSGYYFNELEKYVKQIDFTFSDGDKGSIFIITHLLFF